MRTRIFRLVAYSAVSALLSAPLAAAQSPTASSDLQTPGTNPVGPEQAEDQVPRARSADEALQQDAQEYARLVGVSAEEAQRRLRAMKDLIPVKKRIQETYGARLAGISTEHSPTFQVVVLLTGDAAVPTENVNAGGASVPVIFRTGARSTVQQLRAAIGKHRGAINTLLPGVQGMGVSTKTGELAINVNAAGAAATTALAKDAELEALTGVPVRIQIIDGVAVNMDVRGGSRVEGPDPATNTRGLCTTGFVVKNTAGTTGVATAAHCPDNLTYYNPNNTSIPLTFVAGAASGYGSQDVQIHTSAYVEQPEFYDNTAKTTVRRPVGSYALDATWEGDYACHRGETTGASCAFISWVYYAPPDDKCAGHCEATYVLVDGPTCKGGDSGGPVYDLDLARGLLKGGNYNLSTGACNSYFYMPMDFLPSGWSLLLG